MEHPENHALISVTIGARYGIHGTPSAAIVRAALNVECDVYASSHGRRVNAKSILGLLVLEARMGDTIQFELHGSESQVKEGVDILLSFFEDNAHEPIGDGMPGFWPFLRELIEDGRSL